MQKALDARHDASEAQLQAAAGGCTALGCLARRRRRRISAQARKARGKWIWLSESRYVVEGKKKKNLHIV